MRSETAAESGAATRRRPAPRATGTPPRALLACRMCGWTDLKGLGRVRGYAFLECPRCRFVFTPGESRPAADARYQCGDRGNVIGPAPDEGWAAYTHFLNPAFARLSGDRPQRVLDFGCGESIAPDLLRQRGHRVVTVDLAPPQHPHPDRLTGSILDLDLPLGWFDLVYAFQVFEHLPEPRPILERLLELARPGGLVLIHTDMETDERRRSGFRDWWYVMPPKHCCFYRHRTFEVFAAGTAHQVVWRDPKSVILRRG